MACTADLCDSGADNLCVLDVPLLRFGTVTSACGSVRLARLQDDNRLLFDVGAEPGDGRILVVSVQSKARPAVVGENVARRALENGWSGILVDGAVRDTRVLASIPLVIAAREVRPFRMRTEARGELVDELIFGGVAVRSGDRVVIDEDGIVFVQGALS